MASYYTVEQAARVIGVHPQSVYRWLRKGKISGVERTAGGGIRIPEQWVMEQFELNAPQRLQSDME